MFNRHTHTWKTTGETFTAPEWAASKVQSTGRQGTEALQQILYGFTSIRQECETCGDVQVTKAAGDVRVGA